MAGQLKLKATTVNENWLKVNQFQYSRAFSDDDDPVYVHRFPVYKWALVATLEAEMRLHLKDYLVTVDVYDVAGLTRGMYAPFYYEADTVHRDFIDEIMKNIKKECRRLNIVWN